MIKNDINYKQSESGTANEKKENRGIMRIFRFIGNLIKRSANIYIYAHVHTRLSFTLAHFSLQCDEFSR